MARARRLVGAAPVPVEVLGDGRAELAVHGRAQRLARDRARRIHGYGHDSQGLAMEADEHAGVAVERPAELKVGERLLELDRHGCGRLEGHGNSFQVEGLTASADASRRGE
jgi:hypothetical protein